MGLFPYSTEAYFQCDCCWKAFPPSPEGPFRPGAAVVMGLEEAWSVSTSGGRAGRCSGDPPASALLSRFPATHSRCQAMEKMLQTFPGMKRILTKIVHLAVQLFTVPPLHPLHPPHPRPPPHRPPPFAPSHRREIMKGKPSSRSKQKGCLSRTPFFSGSLSLSFKSKFPLFLVLSWGPVGGQLFCLAPLADLHLHSFSIKVAIVGCDL